MKRKGQTSEESSGGSAPAYIVTFSDMITLLLTFFVMLLSLAETQDEAMFKAGQNAFKRALADFGLSGFMFDKHSGPEFEHPKPKYDIDKGEDEPEDRSIDAEKEMLRRLILDLERTMRVTPSRIVGTSKTFDVTNIKFRPGRWELDNSAEQFLTNYCQWLGESFIDQPAMLYVVGLASEETIERQQWMVSARRAQEVADFIRDKLPKHNEWSVYSWGAGNGGDWAGTKGIVTKEVHIAIAVLTENEQ